MTPINYRYFVRGQWVGPADEKPSLIGAKFLKTLDALSDIDPLFAGWQFTGRWQIPEEHRSSFIPLDAGRKRIVEIVESGVYIDDFNKPRPEYGHSVFAVAGREVLVMSRLQLRPTVETLSFHSESTISHQICQS
jgi:hypothetical protein